MAQTTVSVTTVNNTNATTRRPWPTIDPVILDYWRKSHWIDFGFSIVLVVLGLAFTVLGLIALYRTRHTRPYGFVRILFSLFITLLVNKLTVMVFNIIRWGHKYHWPMGDALCRIHVFLRRSMRGAIIYQILMVSLYMVLAIRKPNWTQRLDSRRGSAIFLGVFWFLVVAFNAEELGAASTRTWGSWTSCWARTRTRQHWNILFLGYILFLMYVPAFLLAGVALYLFYKYRQQRNLQYQRTDGRENPQDAHRVSLALAALFILCRGPLMVIYTRWWLGYWIRIHWNIAFWFGMDLMWFFNKMHSTLVPLALVLFFSDLRFEAKSLLLRMLGRAPPVYSKELQSKKGTGDEENLM